MAWRVDGRSGDLTLSVDGYVLLYAEAPSQRIDVYLDDARIATWRFRFGQSPELPAEVLVPRRALRDGGVAFLTFVIESPRSPADFRIFDDARPLGLHLR